MNLIFKEWTVLGAPPQGQSGFILLRDDITGKGTTVFLDTPTLEVFAVMPGDKEGDDIPCFPATESGIRQLTRWYDLSWARKIFNRHV